MVDVWKMMPVGTTIAALLVGGDETPQELWSDVVGHVIDWGRALLCDDGYGGTDLTLDEPTVVCARGRLLQSRINLIL